MVVLATLLVAGICAREADSGTGAARWYIVHQALNGQGNSLNVGPRAQTVSLNGGWSCLVGPTSVFEAR
jgi:hypothetical protein